MSVTELLKLLDRVPMGYRNLPVRLNPRTRQADVTGFGYARARSSEPKEDGHPSTEIVAVVLVGTEDQ